MSHGISKFIETERKRVSIVPVKLHKNVRILDVGGGGEGIISRIYKDKVVAIDNRLDELIEIEDTESLKAVMDATCLSFIDRQFDRATAFFSCMYMSDSELKKAFSEIYRVLKENAIFEMWDIQMPAIETVDEDIFIAQLEVVSDDLSITTGYGVQLKEQEQSLPYFENLLVNCGFKLMTSKLSEGQLIYIEAIKEMEHDSI